MSQKTFKIQQFDGGFLVYTNNSGKTQKYMRSSVEEVQSLVQEFFTEKEPEKKT